MISQEAKERFIELRAEGLSFDTIGQQLDISKPTLIKMSRELSAKIEQLKYINLEAIAERYKAMKAGRLESIGRLLEKIDSAIEAVDFSRVPAEKLIELRLRLTDKMKAELSESFKVEKGALTELLDSDSSRDFELKID